MEIRPSHTPELAVVEALLPLAQMQQLA